jgi:hypothetical protein
MTHTYRCTILNIQTFFGYLDSPQGRSFLCPRLQSRRRNESSDETS